MAVRTNILQGLKTTLQSLKTKLGNVGIGTPPIQQVAVSGPGVSNVRAVQQPVTQQLAGGRQIAELLVPGALVTGGATLLGTGDIGQAAMATALDIGIGAGGMALAGKFAPGRLGNLTYVNSKGETVTDKIYRPSIPQDIVIQASPLIGGLIMAGTQRPYQPQAQQQYQTTAQQDAQRIAVNNLQQELNVPGTQFQLQGLPQRVLTGESAYVPPNVLDPYGLARGAI